MLDAAFLEFVELLARLPVEVLAVDDEKAFLDVGVVLEEGRGLEGSERLAAAGDVADIAVAAVLGDAIHDGLHRIDLIGPHHQELLFAGNAHHVAADRLAEGAFDEEGLGEGVEVRDLFVVHVCEFIDRQKALFGIESEVPAVIVREVAGRCRGC